MRRFAIGPWLGILGVSSACAEPPGQTDEPVASVSPAPVEAPVEAPAEAPAEAVVEAVVDLGGEPVDPLAGSSPATVLLFVSTHCPVANRHAPTIRALAEAWRAQGVDAWLVYPDPDDDPAAIAAHQADYSLALPTVRDPEHQLVARARVRVTPEAAVFEPGAEAPAYHGRIDDRAVEFGKVRAEASVHDVKDAVEAVLAGRRPAPPGGPAIGCYISDLR
ncbi:redoxin domain-containing protein [Paraliomyxa miuraensis]|uniref:redoxin domain-containing protein n=1 Tax=Paraliomyxa miuraensis TaxID=376150 RepID=UPI002252E09D|nr:redoxin domain-containing protein [Paraliomyxa miuraensis]MCX4243396.1 redoxin domain-containing protein [Paraliomyxa miuraensis]